MPSPVGHLIGGVAAGWLVQGSSGVGQGADTAWKREAVIFGALGALPDVDLLFGMHSGPTHSLGAALLVGVTSYLLGVRMRAATPLRFALACFSAYASHILLDWLARDTTAPIGIMALWPFTHEYYESSLHLFMAVSRRYYQGWAFVRHNLLAFLRELLILMPVLTAAILIRRRRRPKTL
jgi:inner membrane protein